MLKLGTQNISGLYVGEQKIKKAFVGEQLVFEDNPTYKKGGTSHARNIPAPALDAPGHPHHAEHG